MRCPRCQIDNRAERKFCAACGHALPAPCPRCGFANDPADAFCGGCGLSLAAPAAAAGPGSPHVYTPRHLAEKILTSRSALEGERKQVTVLFVDVSGFTSLSERLDPEEVHGVMTRAFEPMLAEVHRYEGTVNQFLGDGIMALFGAPIAHEDHARRAVHAALAIRTALEAYREELERRRGIRFQVRQSLNTGLVVVGSIGNDLRMDYTAVGDTTNVAARLLQAVEPGRIVISDATHRLTAAHFDTRSLGVLALKGKAEPGRAWEVVGARAGRTRLDVEAEGGLTPFVGRDRELRVLEECFEKVRAGHGQVVFVVGEAGIGKSRLLLELRRRLGSAATWNEGRCLSFGRSIAFHPLIDLVKRRFGIEEHDGDDAIVSKVERGVLAAGEDLRPVVPYLRALLLVDPGEPAVRTMSPQERRAEIFAGLRRLLSRAAQTRPQVVVFEDLHWMDKASEAFLGFAADGVPTSRMLMLLTYRPGHAHPLGERTFHTRLALGSLSRESSVDMARAILRADALPGEIAGLIVEKAEGNPFFVEEVVKSLLEIGALRPAGDRYVLARALDEIVVPDTIQDVIMARIDRLEEAPKRALQLASVIGREFTRRLIDRLSEIRERTEAHLRELQALELIYEKSLFPELAYMFKHALTQDVAYGSLLVQRRKELHRLIGLAIEELYADRLLEHYEVLAHHFSKAEEWEKALEYLMKAADKAVKGLAIREALALYEEALHTARRLDERVPVTTVMEIHRIRADLFFAVSEYGSSRAEAERRLELARGAGDRLAEAGALVQSAWATAWLEDFPGALAKAREAIAVSEATGAEAALGGGIYVTGVVHAIGTPPRHDEASRAFGRALDIGRATRDWNRQALALHFIGVMKNWHGHYREGLETSAEGVRLAREHQLVVPLIRCLWSQAIAWIGLGGYEAALATVREGLALTEKIADPAYLTRFLNTLGWLHIECEDLERGLALSGQAVELAGQRRHAAGGEQKSFTQVNQGDALIARGDLALASQVLDEVHHFATNPVTHEWMKWRYTAHVFASLGDLALAQGDPVRAADFANRCLETATPTLSRRYMIRGWRVKGQSALARRHWDEAEQALAQALGIARAIGEPRQIWKTQLAIGQLWAARGQADRARGHYGAARTVVDDITSGLRDPDLRAGFQAAPAIRQVFELSASS